MTDYDYNCPTITLKRGKTVIQIKNAAAVIKRVDEMFPKTSYYDWGNSIKLGRELNDAERARQRAWTDSAKEWFRQEFCGGSDNQFEVIVDDGEPKPTGVTYQPETHIVSTPVGVVTPEFVEDFSKAVAKVVPGAETKPENVRWDILQKSIEFLKWKTEFGQNPNVVPDNTRLPSSENVLDVAQKFAGFVEGKQ